MLDIQEKEFEKVRLFVLLNFLFVFVIFGGGWGGNLD